MFCLYKIVDNRKQQIIWGKRGKGANMWQSSHLYTISVVLRLNANQITNALFVQTCLLNWTAACTCMCDKFLNFSLCMLMDSYRIALKVLLKLKHFLKSSGYVFMAVNSTWIKSPSVRILSWTLYAVMPSLIFILCLIWMNRQR